METNRAHQQAVYYAIVRPDQSGVLRRIGRANYRTACDAGQALIGKNASFYAGAYVMPFHGGKPINSARPQV